MNRYKQINKAIPNQSSTIFSASPTTDYRVSDVIHQSILESRRGLNNIVH